MPDTQESMQAGLVWTRRGFVGALGVLAAGCARGWADSGDPTQTAWRDSFDGRSVARGECGHAPAGRVIRW